MIYIKKRALQISTFRFGQEYNLGSGGVSPFNFVLPQPVFPGDTIFVNIRNGTGAMTSMPGFNVIANTGGLYTAARVVDITDTGTYTFTWSTSASNMNIHAMISGVSLGTEHGYALSFPFGQVICTLPYIVTVPKNATVLYYHTTSGGPTATGRILTPAGYTKVLGGGITRESWYKKFTENTIEGITLEWTGGHGGTTRNVSGSSIRN